MPGAAEIVVVGAGCVGSSVAYRLAQRGARVTVLDAGAPGAGTSGASFAWTNSFGKTPRDYHDLNVAGMEEHATLVKELPGGGWLHQDGALAWEDSPAGCARLDQAVERLAGWGYAIERITPAQAREIEPDLHIAPDVARVIWTPGEGYLDAVPYVAALLAAARRHGARVRPGRRVAEHNINLSLFERRRVSVVVDAYDQLSCLRFCHRFALHSRCLILNSLRPIPAASYQ